MSKVKLVKKCRICSSKRLYRFLDLNSMPIPNGFLKKEDIKDEENFELACFYCEECSLVQLTCVVDPDFMYRNYAYIPSTSKLMMNNFSSLAASVNNKTKLDNSKLVMDIGSNDGSLLEFFKSYGAKVLGIDPAENIAELARQKGIPVETLLFGKSAAQQVVKKYGQADAITATNVIAHIDDLHQVMDGVSILLKDNGVFVTEFPYLLDLITKNQFDTIYHEHLSYFSLRAWDSLINQYDLEIIEVERTFIQGGSIRITHAKKGAYKNTFKNTLSYLKKLEINHGLNSRKAYDDFSVRVNNLKNDLRDLLSKLKKDKKRIIGYGAAAKGNVLTNFFELGTETLDYIADSTPYKQGLLTPGTHIPVYPENMLLEKRADYALILAWNFADEIIEKQKIFLKNGGHFIIPIPSVKIV